MYPGDRAKAHPDRPALIMATTGETLTYRDYETRCNQLAHLFRHLGLGHRDHLAVLMENQIRYPETAGAAERSGLYYTLVSSHLTAEEVAYVVEDCEARLLITSTACLGVARAAVAGASRIERVLVVGGDGDATQGDPRFEPYEQAVAGCPGEPIPDEQLGAAMLYSSGTTGRPKGVWRRLPDARPGDATPLVTALGSLWRLHGEMTYLSPAPLYHAAPHANLGLSLRLGATAVIMDRFDPVGFLELVERYRVTHTQMVPTMFSRLLGLPDAVRDRYDVSSLEVVIHAAAPCPIPVKERMIEWLGPILLEYYAGTEANGLTLCDSNEWLAHRGTVGRSMLGEIVVLDEEGTECPVGTDGTVWFRGATNFEYFHDPATTATSRDPTGTMSTLGDVGRLDEDGYLYLTDRRSFMIISGGVNIYPQEIENLLITRPEVADVAVIGVPHADLGEEVKAVVQLTPGAPDSSDVEHELITFCQQHLARYKCPRSVDVVDELPRLPTGKLQKHVLRDRYWAGHQTRIV
ncbi:MAG: AMP-binding protein [Acidimicrobiales bacterium]|nr:AMP-binding protein [Acidimicrobiales bacterium]